MVRMLVLVLMVIAMAPASAIADQGKGKGKGKNNADDGTVSTVIEGVTAGVIGAVLSDDEKETIRNYFVDRPAGGKVKPLPPGIRKKLARGGTLPPGIAKQALPGDLLRVLPARPGQGYEIIGTDVVLVDLAKDIIVDVLKDVLRGS